MRVITGSAKGKKLLAPTGMDTRPITDRIKEALFNVLSYDIQDAGFLDLFAGSGSVGIEALSRGASRVVFVEKSSKVVKIIQDNLHNCHFDSDYQVYCLDVFRAIQDLHRKGERFDYIYVDPPFTNEAIFIEFMKAIDQVDLLSDDGMLIIRARRKKEMPEALTTIERIKTKDYGESTLHYYRLYEGVQEK
ncbi:MAG: 16S rRNA (guanine(966)-N(2))-methyltransferase RsmD [Bacillota bacterium]|nr:16S rRNA (guanine(966)-N(2))-methyltransferase RsmD [Bacillota bacterium]